MFKGMRVLYGVCSAACLQLAGCASWPEEGKGGWAEYYPPEHKMASETWYWQSEAVLWREFQHLQIVYNQLVFRGLEDCLPGQAYQAKHKQIRIQRELTAELLQDAEENIRAFNHQLVALDKLLTRLLAQTDCKQTVITSSHVASDTAEHPQQNLLENIQRLESLLNSDNLFEFDSFELPPKYQQRLTQAAELMNSMPQLDIVLEGYVDHKGNEQHNRLLAFARANAVKQFLQNHPKHLTHNMEQPLHRITLVATAEQPKLAEATNQVGDAAIRHSQRQVQAKVMLNPAMLTKLLQNETQRHSQNANEQTQPTLLLKYWQPHLQANPQQHGNRRQYVTE